MLHTRSTTEAGSAHPRATASLLSVASTKVAGSTVRAVVLCGSTARGARYRRQYWQQYAATRRSIAD
eukprot:1579338-Rhodomonas_salina.1